jgi:RNA-directed DNA polymerase
MALPMIGASSANSETWESINWMSVEKLVNRLQMRIAKATREGRYGNVKALQWILTHSLSAKLSAVKRVTSSSGSKTPGIDNVIWKSSRQKIKAIKTLTRRGYNPQPLRRVYIPKKNGKLRPLGIPTMRDRAMQAI